MNNKPIRTQKTNLVSKLKNVAMNATIAAAAVLPLSTTPAYAQETPQFNTGGIAQTEEDTTNRITLSDSTGVPNANGYLTLSGSTSEKNHAVGVAGGINFTRAADILNAPVILELGTGLDFSRGKTDTRNWDNRVRLRAGYDSFADFDDKRFTILPEIGYQRRRDFDESTIVREDAISLGLTGTAGFAVNGKGWLSLRAAYREFLDAGNGEMRIRDGQGDRVALELNGRTVSLSALLTMPKTFGEFGLIAGLGIDYAKFEREGNGRSQAGRNITFADNRTLYGLTGEFGLLLPTKRFASVSVRGGYQNQKTELETNFSKGNKDSLDSGFVELRGRAQVTDGLYLNLGLGGQFSKDKNEPTADLSLTYRF